MRVPVEDVYELVNLIFKASNGHSITLETVQEWFCGETTVDFQCFLQSLVEGYSGLLQVNFSLSLSLSLPPSLPPSLSPSLSLSVSLSLSQTHILSLIYIHVYLAHTPTHTYVHTPSYTRHLILFLISTCNKILTALHKLHQTITRRFSISVCAVLCMYIHTYCESG